MVRLAQVIGIVERVRTAPARLKDIERGEAQLVAFGEEAVVGEDATRGGVNLEVTDPRAGKPPVAS
jgi:hypothetical protein